MKRWLVVLFLICLLFATPCNAASRTFVDPDATTEWTDAATGGDELLDLGGLAAAGVVMGSYLDLGSLSNRFPKSLDYAYELLIDGFATAPIVGETVDLYFSQSNITTNFDGNPTTDPTDTVEGAMVAAALLNLTTAISASVYTTTAGDELKISGTVRLPLRYVSPVLHNDTVDALLGTSDAHSLKLTPLPAGVTP